MVIRKYSISLEIPSFIHRSNEVEKHKTAGIRTFADDINVDRHRYRTLRTCMARTAKTVDIYEAKPSILISNAVKKNRYNKD